MTERIVKLQSQQPFNETWKPADVVANPPVHKLVDFTIPSGGTYDLSKSYININMEAVNAAYSGAADSDGVVEPVKNSTDTALYNNDIVLNTNTGNIKDYNTSCSALVRNADLFSQNKGMVESIRSVNKLRTLLWQFENDSAEMHGGLDKFGTFQGRRGISNATSSLVQIIGSNVNVNNVKDTGIKAQNRSRDFRIPLSDLFGVGNAMWNGNYFGDTQIHLELQPTLLRSASLGGLESTSGMDGGAPFFGQMLDYSVAAGSGQLAVGDELGVGKPLITSLTYKDFGLNMPFYVGEAIEVSYTVTSGARTSHQIIEAIEYNEGSNSNAVPGGTERVRIYTRLPIYTNATAGLENVTGILIKQLDSTIADDQIRINKAEIVLNERFDIQGPAGLDYTTYSTEETQGNNATQYNKQIIVEPNAQNLIIAHCASGMVASDEVWDNYRISVNNVDVCGNRNVDYNKPLHKDRISRFFQNRGETPKNMSMRFLNGHSFAQQDNGNRGKLYPILETLPITSSSKTVALELNSGAAKDVIFFKEISRSI
tara:strand:- start:584 stop:2206 length:1623 start_codon:yes stop_codon:yes gene_type:complete